MALDADGCAEIDPIVEPLRRIRARQWQANATVRGGTSRDLPESVNKNILVHLHTPRHRGVVIEPGAMHRRFDWPSLELSRRRLLSFAPAADGTVEHEPRSLIGA